MNRRNFLKSALAAVAVLVTNPLSLFKDEAVAAPHAPSNEDAAIELAKAAQWTRGASPILRVWPGEYPVPELDYLTDNNAWYLRGDGFLRCSHWPTKNISVPLESNFHWEDGFGWKPIVKQEVYYHAEVE